MLLMMPPPLPADIWDEAQLVPTLDPCFSMGLRPLELGFRPFLLHAVSNALNTMARGAVDCVQPTVLRTRHS